MKRMIVLGVLAAVFLWVGSAGATYISDTYIGAEPTHNYGAVDVIGSYQDYNIGGMGVSFSDGYMIVDIYSSYFGNIGADRTSLGDLFISTDGYNPTVSSEYDDAFNGEKWEYVAVLDNHDGTSSNGHIVVRSITYSTPSTPASNQLSNDIRLSNLNGLNPNYWVYRENQEVQYAGNLDDSSFNGSWLIPESKEFLEFSIALTGSDYDWTSVKEFGFHWTMTCANDVIEGSASVPEPSTMLMLGAGFLGLASIGKKKFLKKG